MTMLPERRERSPISILQTLHVSVIPNRSVGQRIATNRPLRTLSDHTPFANLIPLQSPSPNSATISMVYP